MWHFGVDTIGEYTGKEFEVTFGDGISDLYMVYTKRMKDGRIKVRSENQQYPDQRYIWYVNSKKSLVEWIVVHRNRT